MKPWFLLALALLVPAAAAQDETDLALLRQRGVSAELQSKTVVRNPETGRSTLAMIEAYTKGVVADARGDLVLFVPEAGDPAWMRVNSIRLLEAADSLIARLETEGREFTALRALNEKWFPAAPAGDDPASLVARERAMRQMGMPVSIGMARFAVNDDGEVRPSFGVKNLADEVIESLRLELLAFSARGDVVRDRDTGLATQVATLEAVIRPGDTAMFTYTDVPLWVNRMTDCVEIRKIEVRFRGGTTKTVDYQLQDARAEPDAFHVMGECSRPRS